MVQLSQGSKYGDGLIIGQLFADSQDDIKPDMEIINMPEGYELAFGSSVLTAEGDVAYLKSDKTWNWITSGGGGGGGGSTEMTSEDRMMFYYLALKSAFYTYIQESLNSGGTQYIYLQQVKVDNNGCMEIVCDEYCAAIEQTIPEGEDYYIHFISDKEVDSVLIHDTEYGGHLSGFSFIPSENFTSISTVVEGEEPVEFPMSVTPGDKKLNLYDGLIAESFLYPDLQVDGFTLPVTNLVISQ